jgi:hypothetical protein
MSAEARDYVKKLKSIEVANIKRAERRQDQNDNVVRRGGPDLWHAAMQVQSPSMHWALHRLLCFPPQAEHPLNLLTIYGRQLKLYKNTQLHQDTEKGEGLIAWNGDTETMIDR